MKNMPEQRLTDWLRVRPERGPEEGLERILASTRRMRQRPAWTFPESWLPWGVDLEPQRTARAIVLATIALLLLLGVALAAFGTPHRLPPPFGPAGNGVLAYDTGRGGTIYLADANGANPRPLTGALAIQRSPAFAPDGTRFAFWSVACECPTFRLFVANADGTGVRDITGDNDYHVNPLYAPSWAPDSARVAFAVREDDRRASRIYVASVDGAAPPAPITDASKEVWAPTWASTGEWIVFASETEELPVERSVTLVRPDGQDPRVLETQTLVRSVDVATAYAGTFSWSPDGQHVAYVRGGQDARGIEDPRDYAAYLVIAGLDGTLLEAASDSTGYLDLPRWSPDGQAIAYVGGGGVVLVLDLAAGKSRAVATCDGPFDGSLLWSPDGSSLLIGCPGPPRVLSAGRDGSPQAVTLPAVAAGADWQRVAP